MSDERLWIIVTTSPSRRAVTSWEKQNGGIDVKSKPPPVLI
jgi:TusA-related sulfurtransferase